MSAISPIVVKLSLDDREFSVGIHNAEDILKRFRTAIRGHSGEVDKVVQSKRQWFSTVRDGVITLGLLRHALATLDATFLSLPRSIIRSNAELERMNVLMQGLSRETASFDAIRKQAQSDQMFAIGISKDSGYDLKTVTDAFVKFRAAGVDPTNGSLQALIDSGARFGATSQQMHRAAIAIQQMAGKGVISMEELRQQLGEAIPNAINIMARGLNVSMGYLVKKVSTGTVEAQNALAAMFYQMKVENAGAALALAGTWDGLMNRLKTNWMLLEKEIGGGENGFFRTLKDQMVGLNSALSTPEAINAARNLGDALKSIVNAGAAAIRMAYEYADAIKVAVAGLVAYKLAQRAASMGSMAGMLARERQAWAGVGSTMQSVWGGMATGIQRLRDSRAHMAAYRAEMAQVAAQYTNVTSQAGRMYGVLNAGALEAARRAKEQAIHVRYFGDAADSAGLKAKALAAAKNTATSAGRMLAGAAMRTGAALSAFAGGPLGVAVLAVTALYYAYEKLVGEKKRLREEIAKTDATSLTADAFELLKSDTAETEKNVLRLKSSIEKTYRELEVLGSKQSRGELDRQGQRELYAKANELSRLQAELQAEQQSFDTLNEKLQVASLAQTERRMAAQLEATRVRIGEDMQVIRNQAAEQWALLEKEMGELSDPNSKEANEKREKRGAEIRKQQLDAEISVLQKAIAQRNKLLLDGRDGDKRISEDYRTQLALELEQLRKQVEEREELLKQGSFSLKTLGGSGSGGTSKEEQAALQARLKNFDTYALGIEKRLAKLRAKLYRGEDDDRLSDDNNPFLAEFEAMVEAGQFSGVAAEKIEALRQSLRALHAEAENNNAFKNEAERFSEMGDRLQNLSASIDNTFRKRSNQNPFMEHLEAGRDYVRKLRGMEQETQSMQFLPNVDRAKYEGRLADIAKLRQQAMDSARATTMERLKADTERIEEALLTSQQRTQAEYRRTVQHLQEMRTAQDNVLSPEDIEIVERYIDALRRKNEYESRSPMMKMVDDWRDSTEEMDQLWATTLDNFVDTLASGLVEGEMKFQDFFNSFAKMLIKIQMQQMAAGLITSITGLFAPSPAPVWGGGGIGLARGGVVSSRGLANNPVTHGGARIAVPELRQSSIDKMAVAAKAFAKGGIMTEWGELALRKYANGGIAHRPQVAVFGEGSMAEAYVPLPDGRTIPVTLDMKGTQQGGAGAAPVNMVVNVINESGQPVQAEQAVGGPRFDGRQYVMDVVLTGLNRPGGFRDGVKAALSR